MIKIVLVVLVLIGFFFLNNGITGAYFDGCLIRAEYNKNYYVSDDYWPYTDENGIDQLVQIHLYSHDGPNLPHERWEYLEWKVAEDKISFLGWQCDKWEDKLGFQKN
jgi:hypothetical protein